MKQLQVISVKSGKTRASKSRLVLVLLLIDRESGASFFSQSESEVKQNQSKHNVRSTGLVHTKTIIHLSVGEEW